MNLLAISPGLLARRARESDAPFLAQLYRAGRPDLLALDADPRFVDQIIVMQQQAQSAGYLASFPGARSYVLEHVGQAIGRLVLDLGPNSLHLVDISLLAQAQGQGHGSAVLMALQTMASCQQWPLRLSVYHANDKARRWYLKLGFETEQASELLDRLVWLPRDCIAAGPQGPTGAR